VVRCWCRVLKEGLYCSKKDNQIVRSLAAIEWIGSTRPRLHTNHGCLGAPVFHCQSPTTVAKCVPRVKPRPATWVAISASLAQPLCLSVNLKINQSKNSSKEDLYMPMTSPMPYYRDSQHPHRAETRVKSWPAEEWQWGQVARV
jgi:hypothetical protein